MQIYNDKWWVFCLRHVFPLSISPQHLNIEIWVGDDVTYCAKLSLLPNTDCILLQFNYWHVCGKSPLLF